MNVENILLLFSSNEVCYCYCFFSGFIFFWIFCTIFFFNFIYAKIRPSMFWQQEKTKIWKENNWNDFIQINMSIILHITTMDFFSFLVSNRRSDSFRMLWLLRFVETSIVSTRIIKASQVLEKSTTCN